MTISKPFRLKILLSPLYLYLAIFLMILSPCLAAEENAKKEPEKILEKVVEGTEKLLGADTEAVKVLEKQEEQTKEIIKAKEEAVAEVQKEAEKAISEKEAVVKEAEIKEQAAAAAKQEVKTLQKEAALIGDGKIEKKVKEAEVKAKELEKHAEVSKEKVETLTTKAATAQKQVAATQSEFEKLKNELSELKKVKAQKRGWLPNALRSFGIILIGFFLYLLTILALSRFEKAITSKDAIRESGTILRLKTVIVIFRWVGSLLIFGFVLYMILDLYGVNMTPVLAGAGIVGLAFGFGGQYLIRDVINGIFLLIEGQYNINDVVKIGEHGGLVESVNLRHTRLRDLEGRVIYIPNGEITTVINFTQHFAQALLNVGVAYKENVDRAMDVIKEVGKEMRKDSYFGRLIMDDLEMFGVDDFADSQVTIKFRIKTLPIKQWEVAREFRRRLKNRFDELGIEIPFPHRTLYFGTDPSMDWLKQWAAQK